MPNRSLGERLKRGFLNPPTILFGLLTIPVLVIAWQVKPANHDEQIKDLVSHTTRRHSCVSLGCSRVLCVCTSWLIG